MPSLVKIDSLPVPIRFAGWESDTFRLQKAGWQIAAHDVFQFNGSNQVQLILRHEPSKMHAMTAPLSIPTSAHMQSLSRYGDPYYAERFAAMAGFDVVCMGTQVIVHHYQSAPVRFQDFHAIDATPMTVDVKDESFNLADVKVFRPISGTAAEIIIPTHSVAEMMDMVLKLQDPVQKEIRDRRRAEKMRGQWDQPGYDVHADIKCQILAFG